MKHVVTAEDVRLLAESGERELMLREHTLLTDAARDAARVLGVRLVEGSTHSTAAPGSVAPPARPGVGGLPTPAISGMSRDLGRGQTPGSDPGPNVRSDPGLRTPADGLAKRNRGRSARARDRGVESRGLKGSDPGV